MYSSTVAICVAVQCYSKVNLDCFEIYILNPRTTTKQFLKRDINDIYAKGGDKWNHIKYSVKTRKGKKKGKGATTKNTMSRKQTQI